MAFEERPMITALGRTIVIIALLAALVNGACQRSVVAPPDEIEEPGPGDPAEPGDPAGPGKPATPGDWPPAPAVLPRPLTDAERFIVTATNGFTFELFARLADEKHGEDAFVSPLSVTLALGMALQGAEGETFEAMRRTLGFGERSREEIGAAYRGLIDLLHTIDPTVESAIANAIWVRTGFPVLPGFEEAGRSYFDATAEEVDLGSQSGVDRVNAWVTEKTREKIDKILDGPTNFVVYLTNAVYFKAGWRWPFPSEATRPAPFTEASGARVEVPMMHQDRFFPYFETSRFQAVDLPYGADAFAMTIVVPREGVRLATVLDDLDARTWEEWTSSFGPETRVELYLPRFELEDDYQLIPVLADMGMGPALNSAADFTRLSAVRPLWIDEVRHKTFVKVDEKGTEAAAVTGVGFTDSCCPPPPPVVRADRPFLFVIRERLTGTVMFVGKIEEAPRS